MVLAIRQMEKHGLTIDEADVLTGVLTGRSKSATFRTADLSGIDVIAHVTKGLSADDGRGLRALAVGARAREGGAASARRAAPASTGASARRFTRSTGRRASTSRSPSPTTPELARLAQTAARASASPRCASGADREGAFVQRVSVALLSLRADHDAADRVRHPGGRSRDGVGIRLGGRPVQADGPARRRFPAARLRASLGSTSRRCCAKRRDGFYTADGTQVLSLSGGYEEVPREPGEIRLAELHRAGESRASRARALGRRVAARRRQRRRRARVPQQDEHARRRRDRR